MPNSLVHFVVQGVASKAVFRGVDMKWVFLGCILPDIPWIIQRLARIMLPQIDPYTLRLYVIVQASLVFCLVLSAAFAMLSRKPKIVFAILAINSFFHLLLDALEIKLGAGVHFFAPFTWELLTFGLVWPEHIIVTLLTVGGFIYIAYFMFKSAGNPIGLSIFLTRNISLSLIFLAVYFTMPFALVDGPEKYDNHFVKTLQEKEKRVGKEVLLERALYIPHASGGAVRTFAGEELNLTGQLPLKPGAVSIRGMFVDQGTIQVIELHENHGKFRDMASYTAMLLFVMLWALSLFRRLKSLNMRE